MDCTFAAMAPCRRRAWGWLVCANACANWADGSRLNRVDEERLCGPSCPWRPGQMNTIQILIADDHELIRKGLRAVLENQPGWKVCGEAVNGRQAVELAKQLGPDVIVLDLTMPELNGLEATRQIRKVNPRAEVLILTMHESEQLVSEVLAAGAHGYILKADTSRLL